MKRRIFFPKKIGRIIWKNNKISIKPGTAFIYVEITDSEGKTFLNTLETIFYKKANNGEVLIYKIDLDELNLPDRVTVDKMTVLGDILGFFLKYFKSILIPIEIWDEYHGTDLFRYTSVRVSFGPELCMTIIPDDDNRSFVRIWVPFKSDIILTK